MKKEKKSIDHKFYDGHDKSKHKTHLNYVCADCGKNISRREDEHNEGLCDTCFSNLIH